MESRRRHETLDEQHLCLSQSTIRTEGFRSLREGERVDFDLEKGDDGRNKAVNVTGPDGAPPQVDLLMLTHSAVMHVSVCPSVNRVDLPFVHTPVQDLDFHLRLQVASIQTRRDPKEHLDRQGVDIMDTISISILERDTQEHIWKV